MLPLIERDLQLRCNVPLGSGAATEIARRQNFEQRREASAERCIDRPGSAEGRAYHDVTALPQELEAASAETRRFLATQAATLEITRAQRTADGLDLSLEITSATGHKLPTAYPSRRAWLHVVVRDAVGRVVFESGALRPDGSIVGNDNDADATRYEPHHELVTAPDEVQIYEAIMVDRRDAVTTGLLHGVRFARTT